MTRKTSKASGKGKDGRHCIVVPWLGLTLRLDGAQVEVLTVLADAYAAGRPDVRISPRRIQRLFAGTGAADVLIGPGAHPGCCRLVGPT